MDLHKADKKTEAKQAAVITEISEFIKSKGATAFLIGVGFKDQNYAGVQAYGEGTDVMILHEAMTVALAKMMVQHIAGTPSQGNETVH